jgi:hypothetical protein
MGITTATDQHYDNRADTWEMIDRMHSGDGVEKELVRGAYEAKRSFRKRLQRADWKPWTRDLVQRLTGELFSRAGSVTRSTAASDSYLASVGPEGESYGVQLMAAVDTAVAFDEVWLVMDPSRGLRVVEPQHVPRSTEDAVVVLGTRTPSGLSVGQDESAARAWTVYYSDRYEVWMKDTENDDREEKQVDSGAYYEPDPSWEFSGGPPARRVSLPWRVSFGEAVARAHRALYRLESKYDQALGNALGGLLQLGTGGDQEVADRIEDALKDGALGIPYDSDYGEHKPLDVGTAGLGPGADTLERKRRELYRSAYQSLDDASRRMSATEADARNRSGAVAALSQLSETVQSMEETILPIIAEAEDATRASEDLEASVGWPQDFSSAFDDSDEALVQDIFGSLDVPVDVQTAADAVEARVESAGIDPDREAIVEEIRRRRDQDAQQSSLL